MIQCLTLLLALLQESGQDLRLPVPSDADLGAAGKTIREVFQEEYSVKTGSAQLKLARKLLDQGLMTKEDPALQYTLFRESADLAVQWGEPEILIRALDILLGVFAVDPAPLRQQYYSKAEVKLGRPEDFRKLCEAELAAALELSGRDQLDQAQALVQLALGTSKKGKDMILAAKVDGVSKTIAEQKEALDRVRRAEKTLASTPEDAGSHLVMGEYFGLLKGRWSEALPHLGKGSDTGLRALAQKELQLDGGSAATVDAADGWWDLAEREKSLLRRRTLFDHAAGLYERALTDLTGLTKARVEKRLASRGSAAKTVPVAPRGLIAWWKLDEGSGTISRSAFGATNELLFASGVEWSPGRFGKALRFVGTTGFAEIKDPKLPQLDVPQSITWWVNPISPVGTQTILCFANEQSNSATQVGFRGGKYGVWKLGGTVLAMGQPPTMNAWHHGAFVFDGRRCLLYQDGKLDSTTDGLPQAGPVTRCEWGKYWAGNQGTGSEFFKGLLDEVRVYDRVLSDFEVLELATTRE